MVPFKLPARPFAPKNFVRAYADDLIQTLSAITPRARAVRRFDRTPAVIAARCALEGLHAPKHGDYKEIRNNLDLHNPSAVDLLTRIHERIHIHRTAANLARRRNENAAVYGAFGGLR